MCWSRDLSLLPPRNSTGYQSTIATKVVVHRHALLRECRESSCPSTKYGTRIILEPLYEVRPHKDHHGVDLISDALPFGRLWYAEPNAVNNAVDYAKFYSRSHYAAIRVYDDAGTVIATHEHAGDFKVVSSLDPQSLV
jgi:hypothetical protein